MSENKFKPKNTPKVPIKNANFTHVLESKTLWIRTYTYSNFWTALCTVIRFSTYDSFPSIPLSSTSIFLKSTSCLLNWGTIES